MPDTTTAAASRDAGQIYADHIARTDFADLPVDVVVATKRSILDTIGVMLAGSGSPAGRAIVGMLAEWGGKPESTVMGSALKLPAPHAAFANGAMAHQYDYDDTHDEAVAHPTANSLAAGLAVAESLGDVSGRDFLCAVALANDIVCRLGLAIIGPLYDYPFTRPPIIGVYGAAAVSAALLKLTPEQTAWAFGFTLHQTANTLECLYAPGSDVRGLRDGFSTRAGVTAAYMARAGIHGDITAIEGRFGLFNAYFKGEYRREKLLDGLGERYEGAMVSIKPWPSARETHATIHAALDLHREHGLVPEQIESVTLMVGRTNLEFCEPAEMRRKPPRKMDALSSLPFAVAVALCHGRVPLLAYTTERLGDEAVLDLARRIDWKLDESHDADGTIERGSVLIRLRDGREIGKAVRHGLGHPDHPLPADLFRQKLLDCASVAANPPSEAAIDEIIAVVDRLETRSVADLSAALARAAGWEGGR